MRPIAKEIRERVVDSVRNGMSYRDAAKKHGVSLNSVVHWCYLAGVRSRLAHIYVRKKR